MRVRRLAQGFASIGAGFASLNLSGRPRRIQPARSPEVSAETERAIDDLMDSIVRDRARSRREDGHGY